MMRCHVKHCPQAQYKTDVKNNRFSFDAKEYLYCPKCKLKVSQRIIRHDQMSDTKALIIAWENEIKIKRRNQELGKVKEGA